MDMHSVSIIGVGRIGGALAIALSRRGFVIDTLFHRDDSTVNRVRSLLPSTTEFAILSADANPIESDIVIIATADPDIEVVAESLAGILTPGRVVLHTSGSLSSDVLRSLSAAGHSTGSMHPLISISDAVTGSENFQGAYFCIEGNEPAVSVAHSIAEELGGHTFSIPSDRKTLYHAAAVTACGHVVALIDVAIEMLSKCGIEKQHAQEILRPLIGSTISNLESLAPQKALTGSFARLDASAVERHVSAIKSEMSPDVLDVYLLLGERSLELAASNDPDPEKLKRLRDLISIAKRNAG
ncbi:MAG: hypothetical protein DMF63_13725 [Acidobacteria bacterium]|nr:MAG: hypothetical protein DMF63_13725 [Acidobacteriota bacterium]